VSVERGLIVCSLWFILVLLTPTEIFTDADIHEHCRRFAHRNYRRTHYTLHSSHTGKVTGNTIFNVLRLGEVEVGGEGGDRPIDELKIKGIEVLWNPFDDIVPR